MKTINNETYLKALYATSMQTATNYQKTLIRIYGPHMSMTRNFDQSSIRVSKFLKR